ncbi:Alpha-amylase [Paenibacillus plantiphilus]|uniref:Alpha-amylase n=1 Tax=Paenibacillus plantiphilus TaxID=2905650 RepID=A0ABM9CDA0_9BACL|nr:alpha-amylase family glycosyl hydrolase [Paenibacillus plantiphilus]CAH1208979.1 Alpha-amylase [Paenibacillus plantiphilus]
MFAEITRRAAVLLLMIGMMAAAAVALGGCSNEEASLSGEEIRQESGGKVYYEIFVRAFHDSDGDGIGDLRGITKKLDYLEELGVEGIWLMPIHPSPSYHGYDVTDFYGINPDYGTLDDFKDLLKEASERDITVIMDLVVNHTSPEHAWFKSSASDPNGKYRKWYKWIGPSDPVPISAATGYPAYKEYGDSKYLGIFPGSLPDLNFDHAEVRAEVKKIAAFWLELGVGGFRIDAAKHIYEDLEEDKTSKEAAAKNIAWWDEFRAAVNKVNPHTYIVSEVWDDSAAKIGPYLKPFNSSFNFNLANEMTWNASGESASNLAFSLDRIHGLYDRMSSSSFIEAPFLSNHDTNRVMSELNGNLDHAKMAASQLLTMPGNPFIYYGEEIGMQGKKPDEYIREPMIWSQKKYEGQTTWISNKYNALTASVEDQMKDSDSLYSHYRKLIQWRKDIDALRHGDIKPYSISHAAVVAFRRETEKEKVLVLHNLSRKEQLFQLEDSNEFDTLLAGSKDNIILSNNQVTLPPYSSAVLE